MATIFGGYKYKFFFLPALPESDLMAVDWFSKLAMSWVYSRGQIDLSTGLVVNLCTQFRKVNGIKYSSPFGVQKS